MALGNTAVRSEISGKMFHLSTLSGDAPAGNVINASNAANHENIEKSEKLASSAKSSNFDISSLGTEAPTVQTGPSIPGMTA